MGNTYLPVGLRLEGRDCLVVGGGGVALRKVENLLDYDCRVTVVAPEPVEKIAYLAESGKLTLERRAYASPEASKYGLVVSACDDPAVNKSIAEDCGKAGVPVNVVDNPPLCTFVFPAVVRRGGLTISVSTDGGAPFLAAHLRMILEDVFPDRWKKISDAAAEFRKKVRRRYPRDLKKQSACYERFAATDWKELLEKKSGEEIERELDSMLGPAS